MKRTIIFTLFLMFLALPSLVNAQGSEPVIYKNWEMLIETPKMLDISYRVIKCDTANQIHLMIFNENTIDQNAHFELEITDKDSGDKFIKEINFNTSKVTVYKALCEDPSLDALKFNIPAGFNPNAITVKITFKP